MARGIFRYQSGLPYSLKRLKSRLPVAADTTAPVLTLPTATETGQNTGSGTATTDEGNGTLYFYVDTNASAPSIANHKSGSGSVDSGNQVVSATGVQNVTTTGLAAGTTYYIHYLHTDGSSNDSNQSSSTSFTTNAASSFDLTLVAPSNITFDPLCSIHVQWMGTGDLLFINTGASPASIGSTPNGGTITFAQRQTLTVTVKDIFTDAAISGARVYIEAASGGDLSVGTEIMNTTTNGSGVATVTFDYTTDQPIVGYVRKQTSAPFYIQNSIPGPLGSTALNTTVFLVPDE